MNKAKLFVLLLDNKDRVDKMLTLPHLTKELVEEEELLFEKKVLNLTLQLQLL